MPLTLKSIAQFATDLQQGVLSLTDAFSDWTSGSPELALVQAFSRAYGFMQTQIQQVLTYARAGLSAQESTNADLDSYVADYVPVGFTPRLNATYATGAAVFTANQAPTTPQLLAVGTVIQNPVPSPGTAIAFAVIADATGTNASYSAADEAWILPAGETTLTVDVEAMVAGTGSNVLANILTVIASPGVPFDSVTNPVAIDNAQNQETNAALYARFTKWMTGLGGGTISVLESQILAVQPGLTYTINELQNASGAAQANAYTVVVDDGSGAIPAATLTAVAAALDARRAPGDTRFVIAPTNVGVAVAVTGTAIASGFNAAAVRTAIQTAILAFIAANGVAGANVTNDYVPTMKLSYVALANLVASFIGVGTGQGLTSYAEITLDGAQADVALTSYQLATATAANIMVA